MNGESENLLEKFLRLPAASRVRVPALYVVLSVRSVALRVILTVPITACVYYASTGTRECAVHACKTMEETLARNI